MKGEEKLVVKMVELNGTHFQMGLQQSKELESPTHLKEIEMLRSLDEPPNLEQGIKLLENTAPTILQELKGLAVGLDLSLEKVIRHYGGYDFEFPEMGCTAFVHDGHYVRNYDFSPAYYDARLVFSNPTTGYSNVGFSQQVIGRLDGMNEKGLVAGLHFVNNEHREVGFMATTIVRMVLESCANVQEAIELISKVPHGYCYNYSLTDGSGKNIIVEATPKRQLINKTRPLICTNHFESESLQKNNPYTIHSSIERKRFINGVLNGELSLTSLYHHFNDENSPLFFNQYNEYFGTLHTVVYTPKDLTLLVGVGKNCTPISWSFKAYLNGNLKLPDCIKGIIRYAN